MLSLSTFSPAQAVAADSTLRRLEPRTGQLAEFRKQLAELLKHLDPTQRVKHGEKHITAFLEHATGPGLHAGAPVRYVNSKGNCDLVLHFGDSATSPVDVLVEAKGNKNTVELLALKADLKLLAHADGQYLDYSLRVEHDELIVLDNDTDALANYQVAHYDPATGQRKVADKFTRLQATPFQEKCALIEHAPFGVDLNPNSVRICRLRLCEVV